MNLSELTGEQTFQRLRGDGLVVRTGPVVFRLQTPLRELADAVHLLYGDFPVEPNDSFVNFHLRAAPPRSLRRWFRPQVELWINGARKFDPFPRRLAVALLEWGMNWCTFTGANQYMLLHAGSIERGGRIITMPAPPGSGKSTLTAALVHRGWRLMSDEITMIHSVSGRAAAIARPVNLKESSIDVIRAFAPDAEFGPVQADTRKGMVCHMKPPADSVQRVGETALPGWVIFPKYQQGAEPTLTPVPRSRAMMTLIDSAFNYSMLGTSGFEAMTRFIEQCDCYDFTYSRLEDALRMFNELEAPLPAGQGGERRAGAHGRDAAPCFTDAPSPQPSPGGRGGRTPAPLPAGAGLDAQTRLLVGALRDAASVASLSAAQWDMLVHLAERTATAARLAHRIEDAGASDAVPSDAAMHLHSAKLLAAEIDRAVRWECNRLGRALRDVDETIILMKGAAYIIAGLPPARGRLVTDIDLMVRKRAIPVVEEALLAAGFESQVVDEYDQKYYRQWMHEIPPLQHRDRRTVVDLHHTILPETARLSPDARLLLDEAVPVAQPRTFGDESCHVGPVLHMLSPPDLVLHSATHLFQDGEFDGAIRDLADLDDLLRHFGEDDAFWDRLIDRATVLQLTRPCYYALDCSRRLFGTPAPQRVLPALGAGVPGALTRGVMKSLVHRAIAPQPTSQSSLGVRVARGLLFVRGHCLRMPMSILVPHIVRKAFRRVRGDEH